MDAQAERYDGTTILLHWMTAALVVWQWGQAQMIDAITSPGSPGRRAMISLHILGGVTLLVVLAIRLWWRHGRGLRLAAETGALGLLARGLHIALYVLLALVVGFGVFLAWVRGDEFFFLFEIPAFDPGNEALEDWTAGTHGTIANAILILAGLHVLVALAHHYLYHDGVLRRMLPGGR
jgi:cytochrome b561